MLGDPRRERRVKSVAARLANRPEASLPVAMGEDAALEGAYRLLSNELVTLEQLVQPHVRRTAERVRNLGEAYAIHDTTGFTFGGEMRRDGLGSVNNNTDQGFRAHVTLAVSADGQREPLGLLAIGTRARPLKTGPGHSEVERWSLGLNFAEAQVERGQLIHLADRESDIYTLIAEAHQKSWRFIFRAAYDRALLTGNGRRHLPSAHCRALEGSEIASRRTLVSTRKEEETALTAESLPSSSRQNCRTVFQQRVRDAQTVVDVTDRNGARWSAGQRGARMGTPSTQGRRAGGMAAADI